MVVIVRCTFVLLLTLCGGCSAAPPRPAQSPSPGVTPVTPPLPRCENDDNRTPQEAQREHLVNELQALRSSLALLPSEHASLTESHAELSLRLRILLTSLRALKADPVAPVPDDLPMLLALRRREISLAEQLEEGRSRGLGDSHPDLRALVAQREHALKAFLRQLETEEAEMLAFEAMLRPAKAASPAKGEVAVREAWQTRLSAPDFAPDRIASFDPISLRLLALESAQLNADTALLGQTYGSRHPRMIALENQRASLLARFHEESRVLAAVFHTSTPAPVANALATHDSRQDRARQLADEIALLSIQIAAASASTASKAAPQATPCILVVR